MMYKLLYKAALIRQQLAIIGQLKTTEAAIKQDCKPGVKQMSKWIRKDILSF